MCVCVCVHAGMCVCANKIPFGSALVSVTPDMVVCYRCALTRLQSLACLFRKAIPNDQLPGRSSQSVGVKW